MSTTNQIADSLEKSGIPFVRIEGVANGIGYWGLSVRHENVHAEVRECSDWVEMKAWNYTPEQFMDMLVGAGTCRRVFIKDWLWECSECHSRHDSGHLYNFCPNCGRRIEASE